MSEHRKRDVVLSMFNLLISFLSLNQPSRETQHGLTCSCDIFGRFSNSICLKEQKTENCWVHNPGMEGEENGRSERFLSLSLPFFHSYVEGDALIETTSSVRVIRFHSRSLISIENPCLLREERIVYDIMLEYVIHAGSHGEGESAHNVDWERMSWPREAAGVEGMSCRGCSSVGLHSSLTRSDVSLTVWFMSTHHQTITYRIRRHAFPFKLLSVTQRLFTALTLVPNMTDHLCVLSVNLSLTHSQEEILHPRTSKSVRKKE